MKHKKFLIGWILVVAVLAVASILVSSPASQETIQEAMRDAVLHETGRVSLFGLKNVNPGLISGMVVTAFLLIVAALIRIFAIPKFRYVPGKFQMLLEQVVGMFDNLAKSNSPHRNGFLGAYIFAAGVYIFVGTLFELFGVQAVSISGASITLPAPLSDVNGAIALGCLSYLIILSGGIAGNGFKGVGSTLKEFSLPISMSFRLFGALLSGLTGNNAHCDCTACSGKADGNGGTQCLSGSVRQTTGGFYCGGSGSSVGAVGCKCGDGKGHDQDDHQKQGGNSKVQLFHFERPPMYV